MLVCILSAFVNIVKRNRSKSVKMFKYSGIAFLVLITSFIGFGVTSDDLEAANESEKVEATASKEDSKDESKEEKAIPESAEKVEADKKAKADADAKKDADKLAAEKKYYLTDVKPKVDTMMSLYDKAWNELWKPTFEGLGTTVDVYTAYGNMKQLEQRYDSLYKTIGSIDGSGLSKENEEKFNEFKTNMKNAAMWRGEAAEKARKMFDEGNYSPSKFDKVKTDVSYADNEMMLAILALTTLEMALDVDRNE